MMPEDAKVGHGVRAKRSKSGAVSFDLLRSGNGNPEEGGHAAVQWVDCFLGRGPGQGVN